MKQANISLETARAMYEQGGAAKQFALDNYTEKELSSSKYPNKWGECYGDENKWYVSGDAKVFSGILSCNQDNRNVVNTKEQAQAILALTQLLVCRDAYRGEWRPDFKNMHNVAVVTLFYNKWEVLYRDGFNEIFSFAKGEQAEAFLENFKNLLEQVKPLFL